MLRLFPSSAGRETALKKALDAPPPSTSAKSQEYRLYQHTSPIYDGRYDAENPTDTIAPSIELFHPAFAHFRDDITNQDLPVPEHVINVTVQYMQASSPLYQTEGGRIVGIKSYLEEVLGIKLEKRVNKDGTGPDGVYEAELRGSKTKVVVVLVEHKNELGDGGCDPSRQAGLSFTRFVAQDGVSFMTRPVTLCTLTIPIIRSTVWYGTTVAADVPYCDCGSMGGGAWWGVYGQVGGAATYGFCVDWIVHAVFGRTL